MVCLLLSATRLVQRNFCAAIKAARGVPTGRDFFFPFRPFLYGIGFQTINPRSHSLKTTESENFLALLCSCFEALA
jgi:hypothetical protein